MLAGPPKKTHPAVFVASGLFLFGAAFFVVQWGMAARERIETRPSIVQTADAREETRRETVGIVAAVDEVPRVADGYHPDDAREPCKIALRGDSPVARACTDGGIAAAKTVMKRLVQSAKTQGVVFACDSCHEPGRTEHDLVKDAREKFARLLSVVAQAAVDADK